MDAREKDRELIMRILMEYAAIPYAYGDIRCTPVFDVERDHYLLVNVGKGWDRKRVHGCLVHVDIIDDKFWIQRDGTEYSIARELNDAGIPKNRIVLGFKSPEVRALGEYATA